MVKCQKGSRMSELGSAPGSPIRVGLVGATGFLGGALLYGLDHYAW